MSNKVKITSWNINSVRARIGIVEDFLKQEAPDILCLQETKVADDLFPRAKFEELGYVYMAINGQKMHHGVATLSKIPLTNVETFDWQANGEARHVGAALPSGARLENVYIPAGGDIADREENPKFGQKLDFFARMTEWSKTIEKPTIVTGDFNVAPLPSDVWNHKQLLKVVSHTPIEVETMDILKAAGNWTDIGRKFIEDPERLFTWWSYRAKDRLASDRGRRLDHMWVTPELVDKVVSHHISEYCRDWEKPSDHIPITSEFNF